MPQIEVTFDIDANGIVHVSAKDKGTGKEQAMTITGGTALPKEEIDRMVADAEKFAEEDRKRRELAEARNMADNLVYQTEKSLGEFGDKLGEEERSSITSAVQEVKDAISGEDVEQIKKTSDALMQASHKLAEQVYAQSAQPTSGGSAAEEPQPGDEEVVDAEIVEEGESKGA